jgi:hypothetical protein
MLATKDFDLIRAVGLDLEMRSAMRSFWEQAATGRELMRLVKKYN